MTSTNREGTKLIIDRFKRFPNLHKGLLFYVDKVKDDKLYETDKYLNKLLSDPKVELYDKVLGVASLYGVKPDVYLFPRSGSFVLTYSYHYLRKIVKERYSTDIEVLLFEEKHKKMIKRFDPLEKRIDMDHDAYTASFLEAEGFDIDKFAFAVVVSTDDKGKKSHFIYRKNDLIRGSAASMDAKASGLQSEFNKASTSEDRNGIKTKAADGVVHKAIQMTKKVAMTMYMKDYFSDLTEVEDIETEDWNEPEAPSLENHEYDAIKDRLKAVNVQEELDVIAKEIKTMTLSQAQRTELGKIYLEKKSSFTQKTEVANEN